MKVRTVSSRSWAVRRISFFSSGATFIWTVSSRGVLGIGLSCFTALAVHRGLIFLGFIPAGLAMLIMSRSMASRTAAGSEMMRRVLTGHRDTVAALKADPTGALADVLKLHVVSGKIMAADAVAAAGTSIETLGGGKLKVEVNGGEVTVGGAKVVTTDIVASNGVIHVLDSVITAANG